MTGEIPRLRSDIEFVPTVHEGERAVLVRDSLGLIPEPILLQGEGLIMLQLINGRNSIRDIQMILMRHSGNIFVGTEVIEKYLHELDSVFLLDSVRYQEHKQRLIDEYARSDVRAAHLAGRAYPEDAAELRAYLGAVMQEGRQEWEAYAFKNIRAVIAPHIDLELGRRLYSLAYNAVRAQPPSRVVLMGTGHSLRDAVFSLTDKDFMTPLGTVPTDIRAVERLRDAGRDLICPHDLEHRNEHSLEFQVLFLQFLFGDKFTLVPLLCGSLHPFLTSAARPYEIPGLAHFLQTIRGLLEEDPSTLVVAGVDFSHIGLKFGHGQPAASLLESAQAHDRRLLESLHKGDVLSLWSEARRVEDRYHVCGLSTLACLLELLEPSQGHLLGYDLWREEPTQSAVSFASLVMM